MELRCDKCRFWDDHGDEGFCRRNPPVIHGSLVRPIEEDYGDEERGIWPWTRADDWCGEFQSDPSTENNDTKRGE